jgi:tRNA 2-thiouridine synthesizing protein D
VIYSLIVLSPPSTGVPKTALNVTRALLQRGHKVMRVFFLDEGVSCGLGTAVEAQDELDQLTQWTELACEHSVELVLCVSSALRRGVLDSSEAQRHEKSSATISDAFTIGGLGLLVEASASSDRLLTFGGQ